MKQPCCDIVTRQDKVNFERKENKYSTEIDRPKLKTFLHPMNVQETAEKSTQSRIKKGT